ncbi:hypothetical protein UA08_02979 [Talaromyces atroroseus]|uniref:Uncharacterized protein n=1 Tax=Talaromyces atroroseus TaxID=1441469 RepID=A0A225B291_TALAT|nr:hypothetical protein UA08_02979 [Talaromyces atroroseus]OKL62089.1 hypothetical protein UA08_02979 [Talaromyces atroroseus]
MARIETEPVRKTGNIASDTIVTTKKYCQIVCFNLEAIIHLEKWAEAEGFIREISAMSDDIDIHSTVADIILTSAQVPHDYLIRSLQVLVIHINSTKLPGYIRCIFDICIHNHETNTALLPTCESVLDQAYIHAQDMSTSISSTMRDANDEQLEVYPDEELEYLSTTSFNLAVDLYLAGRREDAQRWARKAVGLARLIRDGCNRGRLTQVLEAKYGKWLTYGVD